MTPVQNSLAYDAVVLALAVVVVVLTDGLPQTVAVVAGARSTWSVPLDRSAG